MWDEHGCRLAESFFFSCLLCLGLQGPERKRNEAFDGVIVQDINTCEFYPEAKDCNYRGALYVVLPDSRFYEIVTAKSLRRGPNVEPAENQNDGEERCANHLGDTAEAEIIDQPTGNSEVRREGNRKYEHQGELPRQA
jgi:hypothetical protein